MAGGYGWSHSEDQLLERRPYRDLDLKRLDDFGQQVVGSVPRDIGRLLREARRGKDTTLNRVTVGIMTASLVIGSAIIMTVEGDPVIMGVPVLGAIGFAGYTLALVNSVWVIYGIWRSSRK